MGMCKDCGKVYNSLEMTNGICKNCATPERLVEAKLEAAERTTDLGFGWWTTWAWLGLTIGNVYTFASLKNTPEVAIGLIIVGSILSILILSFNKYAFLIATILSINPLLWIINGIYLKNRWKHPKVNNGKDLRTEVSSSILETVKEKANAVQERVHEYRIQKIAEDESIRVSVKKSMNNSEDEDTKDLQNLINKAVAKGDSETAQALLKILNSKKDTE